jgi:hypothetical protein
MQVKLVKTDKKQVTLLAAVFLLLVCLQLTVAPALLTSIRRSQKSSMGKTEVLHHPFRIPLSRNCKPRTGTGHNSDGRGYFYGEEEKRETETLCDRQRGDSERRL